MRWLIDQTVYKKGLKSINAYKIYDFIPFAISVEAVVSELSSYHTNFDQQYSFGH